MNKIYRIVWNVESGQWVVASEMAKGRKKAGAAKIGATLLSVVGLTLVGPAAFAGTLVNCPGTGANQGYGSDGANGGGAWGINSNYAGCNSSVTNTGIVLNELNNSTLPQANTAGITVGQTKYNAAGTVWVYGPKGIKLEGATTTTGLATFNLGADMTGDKIVNVGAGSIASGSGDAVNGSQLYGSNVAIAAAFGGGSTVDANGYVTKPSYALTKANTITGNTGPYTNVGSALTEVDTALGALDTALGVLNTTANKGFNISADAGATSQNIAPGATAKFAAGTNATVSRAGDTITYGVVANPTFAGLLTANGGLKVGAGQTVDMGANKITNVANGTAATDAVNKSQLDAAVNLDQRQTKTEGDVVNIDQRTTKNEGDIANIDNRTTKNEGDIANLDQRQTKTEGDVSQLRDGVDGLDGRMTTVETNVAGLNEKLAKTGQEVITQSRAYTDKRVEELHGEMDDRFNVQDKRIDRMGAMGSAMSMMTASLGGLHTQNRAAVGTGFVNGEKALSVGYQRAISDRANFSLGGAFTHDDRSVGAAVGIGW